MKVLVILCLALTACATRKFFGDQVLRITAKSDADVQLIRELEHRFSDLDFWTAAGVKRPVDLHVPQQHLAPLKVWLRRNRINYEVFIEDLQVSLDKQFSNRPVQMDLASFDYNVYHTLDEINQWVDDMVSTYSTVSKITYGQSFEGRDLNAIKISKGGSNKPAFVIDCGLHSREWVSPASCMYAAKYLVEASPNSEEDNLLDVIDIYITIIGNPDGYVYTWTNDRMWRKTRSVNPPNICVGVDPNRNWDVNWSGEGASASSCNDAYYGPSVMSEIEVLDKAKFIVSIPNVQGYIDVHAYSQYWMFPYAYTYGYTSDHDDLTKISDDSVAAIRSVHGMSYQSGSISEVIYVASGSTADYMYEKLGIKCSFAAELRDTGRYGFTLPERFIQPTAEETFAGLKVIATAVASGQC